MTTNTETVDALALRTGQDQWTAAEADRAEVTRLRAEVQAQRTTVASAGGPETEFPSIEDVSEYGAGWDEEPAHLSDLYGDVIHAYTRADALADGQLIDVTHATHEVGLKHPAAMTQAAWVDTVAWTPDDEARKPQYTGQDERGRLHDVAWMAVLAARRAPQGVDRVPFRLIRIPAQGRGVRPRYTDLVLHIGPGDNAEPVVTIMRPDED